MPENDVSLTGRIADSRGTGLDAVAVRAFVRLRRAQPGQELVRFGDRDGFTDGEGRYLIEAGRDQTPELLRGAGVFIRVLRDDVQLGESEFVRVEFPRTVLDLTVEGGEPQEPDPGEPNEQPRRVHGTVRDEYGELRDDVTVQAFDRDLRAEQSLGSSRSRAGRFEITYRPSQFRRAEKLSADLVLKVLDGQEQELYRTPVHYNVPDEAEIDIVFTGRAYQGSSQWEEQSGALLPLLEDVAPQELRDDEQFQDITFLAGETGYDPLAIGTWAACFRLAEKAEREQLPIDAEAFFAFLAQGQPSIFHDSLREDVRHADRLVLLEEKLLRGLAELTAVLQESLLDKAVADNLVSARIRDAKPGILAALAQYKVRFAGEQTFGGGKGTIGQLLELVPESAQRKDVFLTAFANHVGPLTTFWQDLVRDEVLPAEAVPAVKRTFELGALTRNHVPLVQALSLQLDDGSLNGFRNLARLSQPEWIEVFKSRLPDGQVVGVPANLDGDDETRMAQYAAILDGQFQRAYPTASFAAKLGRAGEVLPRASEVTTFLERNESLQLDRFRIDHYLAEHPEAMEGVEDPDALTAQLKAVQRAFKLTPTFDGVETLVKLDAGTAQRIYFKGQSQFLAAVKDTPINKVEARRIYRKAESTYAMALTWFGQYNQSLQVGTPFAVPAQVLDAETQAKIAALPNLQSLFGSLDYCECPPCRSVYSPAAYFVDIVSFLADRDSQGTGINAGRSVRDVLFERRPDLGDVELSCDNTNTGLPYVDLVCELLEDVVAPPDGVVLSAAIEADLVAGPAKQPVLDELAAREVPISADALVYAPDSTGRWVIRDAERAYGVRKTGAGLVLLPSKQTFLSAEEVRANPEYINAEAYTKLSGEVFPISLPFDLWNVQSRSYLERLGVPQARLFELFRQQKGGVLAPDAVQLESAWLGLNQVQRQIITGTPIGRDPWELWGLAENGNDLPHPDKPTDPTANVTGSWLKVLSDVPVLLHRTGLTYPQLLQLLDLRFVNPTGSVFVFENADPNQANCDTATFVVRNLTAGVLTRITRFLRLWRALDLQLWELDGLLPDSDPDPAVTKLQLTDAVLQDIARMQRLRQATNLSWAEVRALYAGIDHTAYVDRSNGGVAIQTLYQRLFRNRLVDAVAAFPESPELLTGPISARVPGLLAAFRIKEHDLTRILAHLTPADPLDPQVLAGLYRITVLARSAGLAVEDLLTLIRLSGQDPYADPAATLAFLDLARQLAGSGFSPRELDYLLTDRRSGAGGIALEDKAIGATLKALREGLQRIADDTHGKPGDAAEFVQEKVAQSLALDVPTTYSLLAGLRLPGGADSLAKVLDDPRLLAVLPDDSYQFALDETEFPSHFAALRLLHKNAQVIGRLSLSALDVAWWLVEANAAGLGWPHPADFPIDATGPAVDLTKWVALRQYFAWRAGLPASEGTALELASLLLAPGTTPADAVAALSALTGWSSADVVSLAEAFGWADAVAGTDTTVQQLLLPGTLNRLADCFVALRSLGVTAARAVSWAAAPPTEEIAEGLKQSVKAKYDLSQWLQVITPIQDGFREAKRQALVGWLVAHPNQAQGQNWVDPDGLYGYYLIDVEMQPCMVTTRLKQAAASAQLFAQRCLLNLEVDILANSALDQKWKQWPWMKRYRVWEANRKVFLYPENWIEPELRDEKSPFFVDLEQELLQNEITQETAEQAYLNYLEKLDAVANLEIRATYDEPIGTDESVLHVVGRTRSSASPDHYYRQRINGARWLAWRKIELDISSEHLVIGLHNRRLQLLWPQFLSKAVPPSTLKTPSENASTTLIPPSKYWEIRLFWSELRKGKWTPKVLSDSMVSLSDATVGGDRLDNLSLRTRAEPFIRTRLFAATDTAAYAPISNAWFDKLGKQVTATSHASQYEQLVSPAESRFHHNLILHQTHSHYFYYNAIEESGIKPHLLTAHENAPAMRLLDQIAPSLTHTVIDSQARGFARDGSFFVWDPWRTYFVDYSWRTDWSYWSQAWHAKEIAEFEFFPHYHPYVELFVKELNIWGLGGLLNRRIQVDPAGVTGSPKPFDFAGYKPTPVVTRPYPVEDVDFSYQGAYSPYNWELFFHVPFFIANKLSSDQKFEEAISWFHYIFDPTTPDTTTADPDTPQQRFWITKPFYETTKAQYYQQKIQNIMLGIAKGDAELREQVREWRDNPFNPHLIARMRTVAYQKNVLIKYLRTLIAWADHLFAQDTIESINEATQLYVVCAELRGPRARVVPRQNPVPVKTFNQLQQEGIDAFGNVLTEIENLVPPPSGAGGGAGPAGPELPRLDVLYFGIPDNDKLQALWDTIDDRLFKIRHCMNLAGVVRQLPLSDPPIDPAVLVQATAAGLDIGAVINDLSAPTPQYRFAVMLRRAQAVCDEVRDLGSAMLAALEKRDAEEFAVLRAGHEQKLLDRVRTIRTDQITEALRNKEALEASKAITLARSAHYGKLIDDGWNGWEKAWLGLTIGAMGLEAGATAVRAIGASLALIAEIDAGVSGFGGSPTVKLKIGGKNFAISLYGVADALRGGATIAQLGAGMTSTIGGYDRRAEDWGLQKQLADLHLPQLDKEITAADLRHQIAVKELAGQEKRIEQGLVEAEYLKTKFTAIELYEWMVNQVSIVYFQSYQLAYDLAKRAEQSFRYELGLPASNYVKFGYWDSLKKGLLAGERLSYDLNRLEAAYLEQNKREYELTKHVSLAQLDPVALLSLRENGECHVDLPEALFDLDFPGHYFRRIKSVSLSIPCVAGPYTSIACTLTMTGNQLRADNTLLGGKYPRDTAAADPRFRDQIASVQSIATSDARHDDGMFVLDFADDRYLPFEGAGAISSWKLRIAKQYAQFDLETISDVVLHVSYTAREGGEALGDAATGVLKSTLNELDLADGRQGLYWVYDLQRDFPDAWYRFLRPGAAGDDQQLALSELAGRLPFFTKNAGAKKVRRIEVVARIAGGDHQVMLSALGDAPADLLTLGPDPAFAGMHRAVKDLAGAEVPLADWVLKLRADGAADWQSVPPEAIEELFLIINYTVG
ncbi:neuraminidase-like domain-containing protein [Kribbella sp. CA-293567]|uniref:Tc toxin subunit A-related protein n=1 Tax=Kribbella sp. CA-293567 TaxID=3002436 RepID=UPI0022DE18B2|nr:neuraminidase-like domain-containing protein [Kribbella sp. CA-293567]WBQ08340.1 neuraminidase-like domain-containing protein [Kribbella sp. CA-293567]